METKVQKILIGLNFNLKNFRILKYLPYLKVHMCIFQIFLLNVYMYFYYGVCFPDAKVTFSGHEHNIRAAIFAHFDKQIISASDDKTVR